MATDTVLIPLSKGFHAKVDAADAEWLQHRRWYACRSHGSHATGTGRHVATAYERAGHRIYRTVYMHRLIMGLDHGDGLEVDHINHDVLDNRRCNLRVVTPTQNKRWQASRGGSSQYVGVTWDAPRKRWRAQIQIDGKVINLGRYATERDAALARDRYVLDNATGHELNLAPAA